MPEDILINISSTETGTETRVALTEDNTLQEIHIEQGQCRSLIGNIYRGKVSRVLPDIQAAFVDIGLQQAAFLPLDADTPSQVREGEILTVQIIKDAFGEKGARLTTQLSLTSPFLVFTPHSNRTENHIGISKRISSDKEKERLRQLLNTCMREAELSAQLNPNSGFIIRTASENITQSVLSKDVHHLSQRWQVAQENISRLKNTRSSNTRRSIGIVHEEPPLYLRAVQDLIKPTTHKIRIDSEIEYQRLVEFTNKHYPLAKGIIEYFDAKQNPQKQSLFSFYGIEKEISSVLSRSIPLNSGGYLFIEQTEAMVSIDVNSGSFVGTGKSRATKNAIVQVNLEAAAMIARQLRLRNLSGIIVIDFIDMQNTRHQQTVFSTLKQALAKDKTPTTVFPFSPLGLIEMTRKRTRKSLATLMSKPCSQCGGTGLLSRD